jgi:ABC-2 type transport system permease protein
MMPLLRAELRKLLTIRSTYVLSGVALLLVGFLSFWVMGYRGDPISSTIGMDTIRYAIVPVSVFSGIVGILMVTHEYRYNTIMYTLTASNSRTKVLAAKVATIVAYTAIFTLLVSVLAAGLALWGVVMHYDTIVPQHFYYWDTAWRALYYTVGYALTGTVIAVLFRHVVGAMVTFLIVPSTVEGLLGLLLKGNAKYMPFTVLDQVQSATVFTPLKAAGIFAVYLVAAWLLAWALFLRRDAN